jgi:hypothetical protein
MPNGPWCHGGSPRLIVTTQSSHDRALRWFYKMAATAKRDAVLLLGGGAVATSRMIRGTLKATCSRYPLHPGLDHRLLGTRSF